MKQCLKQHEVNNSKEQKSRYTTALFYTTSPPCPFVQHSAISNRNTILGVCMLKRLSALCRRK